MTSAAPQPVTRIVQGIVQQHFDDAVSLYSTRSALIRAPHIKLRHLRRFDDRLEAHLEGLAIAGEAAKPIWVAALETGGTGEVFVATIRALESQDPIGLGSLLASCETVLEWRSGLISALGWSDTDNLRGVAASCLSSEHPFARLVGLAACAVHRVDPGLTSVRYFEDESPVIRARAWRTAAEIGKRELVSTAAAAVFDPDPACQFWAAWAAVLLGNMHGALDAIASIASGPGPFRARAFQLALQAQGPQRARGWLATFAPDPRNQRWMIRGAGLAGDPAYVPWLMGCMAEDDVARLSGESFSLVTGLDLALLGLDRKRPEDFESGPNDDPNDPNVDMDEDDGLPWPDVSKIEAWWHANASRFQPGMRYFMGQPLNRDHCLRVLKEGFQRQRIAAALYLSLLNPGTPLFEWRAPARRQQRLLAEMS
jgi:uncharacterized protein (TIGR02270 family)